MLVIGIDPGISGSICFFNEGKIVDVVEMPTMIEGKKNKKQVNGAQIFNEISERIKKLDKRDIEEIKPEYIKGLKFHYVKDMSQVIDIALTKQKVKNAKIIS